MSDPNIIEAGIGAITSEAWADPDLATGFFGAPHSPSAAAVVA